jgi:hypothetical protein
MNAYRLHGLPYSMHQGIVARVKCQVGNSRHDTDGPQIGGSTILDERKRSRLVVEILPSMWWAHLDSNQEPSGYECSVQYTPGVADVNLSMPREKRWHRRVNEGARRTAAAGLR